MRKLSLVIPMLVVAACGSDDVPAGPDAGDVAPLLDAPPEGAGLQLGLDVALAAGDELEQCQYVRIDDALEIARFEHVYSTGSHHLLLYQTDLTEAPTDPFDCTGAQLTELGVRGIAYAAQVPGGELAYPEDVALKFPAGSVLLMQTHYLNAGLEDLDAQVRLNLWFTETPAAIEAGTLFFYDWAIVVPDGEPATARMQCQIPSEIDLVFGMSHMHRRGVGYQATLDGDTMLFETEAWQGIEPRHYAPHQRVAAGSSIEFHCDYQGEAGRTIIEGPSAEANEMCMFIASYYPRLDPAVELCAAPGSGPVFDGDRTCAQTVDCARAAADDLIAQEQCLVDTCAASSQPAADLMTCMFYSCADACDQLGAACDSCVLNRCTDAFGACQTASC